jgi:hypothetical protein
MSMGGTKAASCQNDIDRQVRSVSAVFASLSRDRVMSTVEAAHIANGATQEHVLPANLEIMRPYASRVGLSQLTPSAHLRTAAEPSLTPAESSGPWRMRTLCT